MKRARVAIVGATGYTGSELLRLLAAHPGAEIAAITSRSRAGEPFSQVHGAFRGLAEQRLVDAGDLDLRTLDLVFLALPHGASMDFVASLDGQAPPVIDLSGDFRLPDAGLYAEWYGQEHRAPERLGEAVFGLPELFRDELPGARLVANPGCYPTAAALALAPLLRRGLVDPEDLVVDAKSGVTGAGASAKAATHFPEVVGDFKAYGLLRHRHTPEIEATLARVGGRPVTLLFTPHLLPVDRGILATCYARPAAALDDESLRAAYEEDYAGEPFIRLMDAPPSIKEVRGSNFCDVHVRYDPRTRRVLALAAIDNLVKGAAGQAIQNMNLLLGLPESTGLTQGPLFP